MPLVRIAYQNLTFKILNELAIELQRSENKESPLYTGIYSVRLEVLTSIVFFNLLQLQLQYLGNNYFKSIVTQTSKTGIGLNIYIAVRLLHLKMYTERKKKRIFTLDNICIKDILFV